MKKYDNLWDIPVSNEDILSTDNIEDIMDQQIDFLKKSTNKKIFGKFYKIKKVSPLSTMGHLLAVVFASQDLSQHDEENDSLQDANDWYKERKYGFEIYNSAYKFRVLEMVVSPVYPIYLIIDEDIANSIHDNISIYAEKKPNENYYTVNSDENLLECLSLIFKSRKMRLILYKLQQETNKNSDVKK